MAQYLPWSVRVRNGPRRHDRVVTETHETAQAGQARSPADAEALARFNQRMALPLIISAVVPLFLLPGGAHELLVAAVFIASWLVFLVDLVVHERRVT